MVAGRSRLSTAHSGQGFNKLFAAVNPIGKDMLKPRKAVSQVLEQGDRAMDILNVRRMDMGCEQKAVRIGDDVPLAPMQAFAGIEATRPSGLRCRSSLAVDDGSRRR